MFRAMPTFRTAGQTAVFFGIGKSFIVFVQKDEYNKDKRHSAVSRGNVA